MDDEVAAFQAALLEVLATASDGPSALGAWRRRPEAAPFLAWIDRVEPRMLTVAAALVRRWGAAEGMAPPATSG